MVSAPHATLAGRVATSPTPVLAGTEGDRKDFERARHIQTIFLPSSILPAALSSQKLVKWPGSYRRTERLPFVRHSLISQTPALCSVFGVSTDCSRTIRNKKVRACESTRIIQPPLLPSTLAVPA